MFSLSYANGEKIRLKSKFASEIAKDREKKANKEKEGKQTNGNANNGAVHSTNEKSQVSHRNGHANGSNAV